MVEHAEDHPPLADPLSPSRTLLGWSGADWAVMIAAVAAMSFIVVPWVRSAPLDLRSLRLFTAGVLALLVCRAFRHTAGR